ncbi:MAG: DNA replication ATP-dependent helicase Dna2, partial [Saprospiraceae bacterium]
MIDFTQLGDVFYKELRKLNKIEEKELQFSILYRTVNRFFIGLTKIEKIQFTTIFSKVSYVFHKYNVSSETEWQLHEFRKAGRNVIYQSKPIKDNLYLLGFSSMCKVIEEICGIEIPEDLQAIIPTENFYDKSPIEVKSTIAKARVVVSEIREKERLLICYDETQPQGAIKVRYDETAINEQFHSTITLLKQIWSNYTTLNLLDISVDEHGIYYPKIFIIEPDYLIDVSAIAGCFNNPTESILYLVKKFLPFEKSQPLVVGNIANHFLDDLMNDDEISFNESFPKVFKANPLTFTMFDDAEVREIMSKSKKHFWNLRQMVKVGFEENDINPANCYLEPSFFSEDYGIQGRLDVWYQNPESEQNSAIVELKSGSAYMANQYGISDSHYVQALLYDLMVKSVYQQRDPRNYILYSKNAIDNLRFAPVLKTKQNEALSVRNQIITLEQMLVNLHQKEDKDFTVLDRIRPERYPKIRGFNGKNIQYFSKVINSITTLERNYFLSFCSFIAREHQLSKMGIQGNEQVNGLASLWLNPYEEKNESFDILSHLTVQENRASHDAPIVLFERSESTNDLANFRVGDIAILYPANAPEKGETALSSQIFKCSVISVDKYYVGVKLRFKQFNNEIFEDKTQKWVLEHDQMDHSYNAMYRALFAFLQFEMSKKMLVFANRPPKENTGDLSDFAQKITQLNGTKNMTEEQKRVLTKALIAPEYFLLWGPPGTGKTSVMLRTMVEYLYHHTNEDILLLAYTNRAVDEICEAIESVSEEAKANYIRIGNQYSASEASHHALFNTKIEKVKRRDELKGIIHSHRIFVATVASIHNRQELLLLKQFSRVIIDEASQILEPMLIGLLPQFERFILIGDHKQLPAVVQQEKQFSAIKDADLKAIGLHDMR